MAGDRRVEVEHRVPEPRTPREPPTLWAAQPLAPPGLPYAGGGGSVAWDTYKDPDPGPPAPPGLLRLEELVRGFLISKETLSVRMLDDSRDPTPLLKEIRDDKVSTIIIDANASISHLILRKVRPLVSASLQARDRNIGVTASHPVPSGLRGHMVETRFQVDDDREACLSLAALWLGPRESPALSVHSCEGR